MFDERAEDARYLRVASCGGDGVLRDADCRRRERNESRDDGSLHSAISSKVCTTAVSTRGVSVPWSRTHKQVRKPADRAASISGTTSVTKSTSPAGSPSAPAMCE